MRYVDPAAQAIRQQRLQLTERVMIWVDALDRESLETQGIGFWTGADNEMIRVTDMFSGVSQSRQFIAMGSFLGIGSVTYASGLDIRPVSVTLSSLSPEVQQAFQGYEPRGARVQIWRRSFSPITRKPVAVESWYKGYVDKSPITRPTEEGLASIEVSVVSTARMLTFGSATKKSDEAQKTRSGDRFRKYKATIAQVVVPWGVKDERQ